MGTEKELALKERSCVRHCLCFGGGMSGIRARRSLGTLGRALFEFRSAGQRRVRNSPSKEELFRHVDFPTGCVPSRSFGSFLEERFSVPKQVRDSGESIKRRWVTCKPLSQVWLSIWCRSSTVG